MDRGLDYISKINSLDEIFKKSLRDWIKLNKPKIIEEANKIFCDNAQRDKENWMLADYSRWIYDKQCWNINV